MAFDCSISQAQTAKEGYSLSNILSLLYVEPNNFLGIMSASTFLANALTLIYCQSQYLAPTTNTPLSVNTANLENTEDLVYPDDRAQCRDSAWTAASPEPSLSVEFDE